MRRVLSVLALLSLVFTVSAQVCRWKLHPEYDTIKDLDNGLYLVSQSGRYGLMDGDEKKVLDLKYDSIADFREGYALLFNKEDDIVVGYTDEKGEVLDLSAEGYKITNNYPYFSCGFLLVEKAGEYYFISAKSTKNQMIVSDPFPYAQPFFYNKATVKMYKDLLKRKVDDVTWAYLDAAKPDYLKRPSVMTISPEVDNADINFLSSVSKGKSVVVYKKRYHMYDVKTGKMTLMRTDKDEKNKKNIIVATDKDIMPYATNNTFAVSAKNAQFFFDDRIRLAKCVTRNLAGKKDTIKYEIDFTPAPVYESSMEATRDERGVYGLSYNDEDVLPAQFQNVLSLKNDEALVKKDNKLGLVYLDKRGKFEFSLNNNNPIMFVNDKFSSLLRMTMPRQIKCDVAYVKSLDEKNFDIVQTTRNPIENAEINAIEYNCTLNIPEDISGVVQPFDYYFYVAYDGLRSIDYSVNTQAWYAKYLEVELQEATVQDHILMMNFKVSNSEETPKEYRPGYREANLKSDMTEYVLSKPDKKLENIYSCSIGNVDYGDIPFTIILKEGNCPEIEYDFTLNNPKPVAKTAPTTPQVIDTKGKKSSGSILPKQRKRPQVVSKKNTTPSTNINFEFNKK